MQIERKPAATNTTGWNRSLLIIKLEREQFIHLPCRYFPKTMGRVDFAPTVWIRGYCFTPPPSRHTAGFSLFMQWKTRKGTPDVWQKGPLEPAVVVFRAQGWTSSPRVGVYNQVRLQNEPILSAIEPVDWQKQHMQAVIKSWCQYWRT